MLSMVFELLTVSTLAVTCAAHWAPRPTPGPQHPAADHVTYTTVKGFFLQDEDTTVPATFDYTAQNFGLINRTYPTDNKCDRSFTQWQKFEHYVDTLNKRGGKNVDYKVLFLGRHGEGYHNVAESYYGTPAWNCYWSLLDGNGTSVWADAHITPNGVAQAEKAANYWASRITLQKIPLPESYYTSPLTRCLETASLTFSKLPLPRKQPFIPTVKEFFREGISGHTCDRRSSKTYIHNSFPTYKFERGFSEQDLLFEEDFAEQSIDQDIRSKIVLDDVFGSDENTWLSVTSHSGEIASLLRGKFSLHSSGEMGGMLIKDLVLGHQDFRLSTGAVIPVLVKAETIKGDAPVTSTVAWSSISTCSTVPPLPTAT
ncbi:histidine phosphatase superfamily [Amylocarpus encephaloides]|uniref:Histidine phosphatase superfamily n=1 Tax=Amylocarpus encephaloides TaxID=45428 RepID=A0A9P8C0M8_9HELO|nr:histidine phosphatase superfamily [Amylocarpus encephaloides]